MDILISFVNQNFTPKYKLGIFKKRGDFHWVKGDISGISNGITGVKVYKDKIYAALQQNGIAVLDKSFNLVQHFLSENIVDPHSITIHDKKLYVVSTGKNSIYKYGLDELGLIKKEQLFWRYPNLPINYDYVHLNSFLFDGDSVYVTLFGHRKKGEDWTGVRTGKIIDVNSGKVLLDNLHHPHSLCKYGDDVIFCESKTGEIKTLDGKILKKFDGYIRGLSSFKGNIIVTENARRKLSKSKVANLSGRIRDFEDEGVNKSYLYFLSPSNFRTKKKVCLSNYGNEVYDLLPINSTSFNMKSEHLKNSKIENRALELENILVARLIEEEKNIEKLKASQIEIKKDLNLSNDDSKRTINIDQMKEQKNKNSDLSDDENQKNKSLKEQKDTNLIQQLMNQIELFNDNVNETKSDLWKSKALFEFQKLKLKDLNEQYEKLANENDELEERISKIYHDLQKSELQFHQKSFEHQSVQKDLETSQKNNVKLESELRKIQSEKSKLYEETVEVKNMLKLLENNVIKDLKDRLNHSESLKDKISQLSESKNDLIKRYKDIQTTNKALKELNEELENQNLKSIEENQILSLESKSIRKKIKRLEKKNRKLDLIKEKLSKLKWHRNEILKEYDLVQQKNHELNTLNKKFKKDKAKEKEEKIQLLEAWKLDIKKLKKLKKENKKVESLKGKIEKLKLKKSEVLKQIDSVQQKNIDLKTQNNELKKEKSVFKIEQLKLRKDTESKVNKTRKLKDKLKTIIAKKDVVQSEKLALQKKNGLVNQRILDLENKFNFRADYIDKIEKENEIFDNENRILKEKLSKNKTKVDNYTNVDKKNKLIEKKLVSNKRKIEFLEFGIKQLEKENEFLYIQLHEKETSESNLNKLIQEFEKKIIKTENQIRISKNLNLIHIRERDNLKVQLQESGLKTIQDIEEIKNSYSWKLGYFITQFIYKTIGWTGVFKNYAPKETTEK